METLFGGLSVWTILAITLWTLPWTAWALWLAARRNDLWWFLAMLVLNTVAILEIIYIFFIAKESDKREPKE